MNNKEITQPGQSKIIEEIIPGSDKEKEEEREEKEERETGTALFTPGLGSRLIKLAIRFYNLQGY